MSAAVRTIRTESAAREAASRVCIVYSMCPGPARRPAPTHDAGTLAGPFVLLRPIGFVVVPRFRDLADVFAVAAHGENLILAGAVRHEGDLRAARRPGARRVRGRVIREPPHVRTVTIRDVDFGIAVAIGHEAEARPIG